MNYVLFDGAAHNALLPFTHTRPVADIRVGIFTIREKWELFLKTKTFTLTEDYLAEKYPLVVKQDTIFINASFLPDKELVAVVSKLKTHEAVFYKDELLAYCSDKPMPDGAFNKEKCISYTGPVFRIEYPWDIFRKNGDAINIDYQWLHKTRKQIPAPDTVQIIAPENVFIEEGASLSFAMINASSGPVYIGRNATVMEGCLIRGPFSLGEGATLKMGAKIYGPTTIGPYCKAGGEITNSILFGNSNKAHDGYLGNSVIGEWCNLGADSNTSNLKNDYSQVRLWSYETESYVRTGLQFCGLMMGDHSKCAINTMFNTGTVVGVNANIFGSGFPRNFIPSFTWGGASKTTTYQTKKAFEVARAVMKRRDQEFTEVDEHILTHIFEHTRKWRRE
ncbi:GlmU family protein [Ascidiimonas aurantiaca]|uniref:GlmU family protein n=1 Tax=Ascidiimonas aurantiaca TaxID=1685432 RepID=UPI0030EB5A86